jgi:hypothetical protein
VRVCLKAVRRIMELANMILDDKEVATARRGTSICWGIELLIESRKKEFTDGQG